LKRLREYGGYYALGTLAGDVAMAMFTSWGLGKAWRGTKYLGAKTIPQSVRTAWFKGVHKLTTPFKVATFKATLPFKQAFARVKLPFTHTKWRIGYETWKFARDKPILGKLMYGREATFRGLEKAFTWSTIYQTPTHDIAKFLGPRYAFEAHQSLFYLMPHKTAKLEFIWLRSLSQPSQYLRAVKVSWLKGHRARKLSYERFRASPTTDYRPIVTEQKRTWIKTPFEDTLDSAISPPTVMKDYSDEMAKKYSDEMAKNVANQTSKSQKTIQQFAKSTQPQQPFSMLKAETLPTVSFEAQKSVAKEFMFKKAKQKIIFKAPTLPTKELVNPFVKFSGKQFPFLAKKGLWSKTALALGAYPIFERKTKLKAFPTLKDTIKLGLPTKIKGITPQKKKLSLPTKTALVATVGLKSILNTWQSQGAKLKTVQIQKTSQIQSLAQVQRQILRQLQIQRQTRTTVTTQITFKPPPILLPPDPFKRKRKKKGLYGAWFPRTQPIKTSKEMMRTWKKLGRGMKI